MCDIFILYPATCGPRGHVSGSVAAKAATAGLSKIWPYPVPYRLPVLMGLPYLLDPRPLRKGKGEERKRIEKKERKNTALGGPSPPSSSTPTSLSLHLSPPPGG